MTDDDIKEWNPKKSPTIAWLNGVVEDLQGRVERKRKLRRKRAISRPALCSNDQLFDLLAKKYLSANNSWSGGVSVDSFLLKWI